jgi:hypothetical protein
MCKADSPVSKLFLYKHVPGAEIKEELGFICPWTLPKGRSAVWCHVEFSPT